jgi:hypothetical protein
VSTRIQTTVYFGYSKFFRQRLLNADSEKINGMIESMEQEAKSIREESFRLAWHMRGGITYEQVLMLSNSERVMISDLAKDNLETTKKTNLPYF